MDEDETSMFTPPVFCLSKNTLSLNELQELIKRYGINESKYNLTIEPTVSVMTTRSVPIPLAHFRFGLRLPLDSFLAMVIDAVGIQPCMLHPNAVKVITCFVVFCRCLGTEPTVPLFLHYYEFVRPPDSVTFVRLARSAISLFDPPSNKGVWKNKWVLVESANGFPFRPLVNMYFTLKCKDHNFTEEEDLFINIVEKIIGSDPRKQIYMFSSFKCLSAEYLEYAGIGNSESRKASLGINEDHNYPLWTIHKGNKLSIDCGLCRFSREIVCGPLAVPSEMYLKSLYEKREAALKGRQFGLLFQEKRAPPVVRRGGDPKDFMDISGIGGLKLPLIGMSSKILAPSTSFKRKRHVLHENSDSEEEEEIESLEKKYRNKVTHDPHALLRNIQDKGKAIVPDDSVSWLSPRFRIPTSPSRLTLLKKEIIDSAPLIRNFDSFNSVLSKELCDSVLLRAVDADLMEHLSSFSLDDLWKSSASVLLRFVSHFSQLRSSMDEVLFSRRRIVDLEQEVLKLQCHLEGFSNSKKEASILEKTLLKKDMALKKLEDEIQILKSDENKSKVKNEAVAEYKISTDFTEDLVNAGLEYENRRATHMIRHLWPSVENKESLIKAYLAPFDSKEARIGAAYIPYSEMELDFIRNKDVVNGISWSPPPIQVPTFWDMVGKEIEKEPNEGVGTSTSLADNIILDGNIAPFGEGTSKTNG